MSVAGLRHTASERQGRDPVALLQSPRPRPLTGAASLSAPCILPLKRLSPKSASDIVAHSAACLLHVTGEPHKPRACMHSAWRTGR